MAESWERSGARVVVIEGDIVDSVLKPFKWGKAKNMAEAVGLVTEQKFPVVLLEPETESEALAAESAAAEAVQDLKETINKTHDSLRVMVDKISGS